MVNLKPREKIKLSTNPNKSDLEALNIGDVVYLDGVIYTAREGVYKKVLEEGSNLPIDLPKISATNFHCSPAAVQHEDGSFSLGAVTATASFRFSKWIGAWLKKSGAKLIIGKGGMSSKDYKDHFVPHGALYLTTVGYGTGALLGRGVKGVKSIHWKKEIGLAQAMWVIQVKNFGPLLVESDFAGNSLFERENEKIKKNIENAYEGTKPAILKRFGETNDRTDELI
jgi:L(+)-tartrate dehydratase beta subunit